MQNFNKKYIFVPIALCILERSSSGMRIERKRLKVYLVFIFTKISRFQPAYI